MGAAVLGLALLAAPALAADHIKTSINFEVTGFAGLSKEQQATASNQAASTLQKLISGSLTVRDMQCGPSHEGFGISVIGEWNSKQPLREAAEVLRNAGIQAAAAVNVARTSVSSFRVEVDDAHPNYNAEGAKEEYQANRDRARPQPRIDVDGADLKEHTFQKVLILDVPLVRALEVLNSAMPVAFVLHGDVVRYEVHVSLINCTLDETLAAIADSAGVKLERHEKFVTFVRPERPERKDDAPAPERGK